jgi:ubiquinone/menaquinone biosynthesis C-methylase UbiE
MAGFSLDEIRAFWTEQAKLHGRSFAASWSDQYAIDLEIRTLTDWFEDGNKALDVGCANGYSTLSFAAQKRIAIKGVDYIPEMVTEARKSLADVGGSLKGSAEFDVGDITSLTEPENTYDRVVVIRVVINLHDWETQQRGLREVARVVRPGGLLLLSEATLQGWKKMNQFRQEWGLAEIPMPPFNQYLDEDLVIETLRPSMDLVKLDNFASSYYVGTRVLKPLLSQALGGAVDASRPEMEWNRWFSQLPAAGDYGTQKLFIFRKRG